MEWKRIRYDKNNNIVYELKDGNGHVKEYGYIGSCLIFEGEYLNGKRNGKGKNYNKIGKLTFEGEYLKGIRWNGKAKEYDDYGNLKFEGEYIIGEKKGTYYDSSSDSSSDLFWD